MTPSEINARIEADWPDAGGSCIDVSSTHATAVIHPGHEAMRPGGYISGPTLFAAADAALWYLVFGATGRIEPLALTSELSIRFLSPALGNVVYARAALNRANRRSVIGTITVWTDENEHEPCATAQGTYILPKRGSSDDEAHRSEGVAERCAAADV